MNTLASSLPSPERVAAPARLRAGSTCILLACLLAPAGPTAAIETREQEIACPACGLMQRTVVPVFSVHDHGLDGEPRWIDGRPGAWPDTLCTQCRFPLSINAHGRRLATLLARQPAALAAVRDALQTVDYLRSAEVFPSSFLQAMLAEKAGGAPGDIADLYLQSTWQDSSDATRVREALVRSLRWHEKLLATPGQDVVRVRFRAGEIERRLGDFDAALLRFQGLRESVPEGDDMRLLIEYESHLIASRDAERHLVSDATAWRAGVRRARPEAGEADR